METGNETYILIVTILIASLILVFIDAIVKIKQNKREYNRSSFKLLTNYKLRKVMSNKLIAKQYKLFEILEKSCLNGHLLANLVINDINGNEVKFDIVMIDKYGISVFDVCDEDGTLSGSYNTPFWKLKKKLFTYKIPNYSLVMNRKIEVLKEKLKITDSDIINGYIVFDKQTSFKNMRLENKNIKILKTPYVNGALAYEVSNINRVISDSEIMSYTVLLEKYTCLPIYLRDEKILLTDSNNEKENESGFNNKKAFSFEFYRQVSNYQDLKMIWNVTCKCDKDVYPSLSLRRNDLDDIPVYAREMLLPNNYYKHIIHNPMIIVRKGREIVGYLSIEPNKILKLSEELGRVNLVDNACVLKEYRKEGLVSDLYDFVEYKIPDEFILPYILVKSSSKNDTLNRMLLEKGYKEKIIVDTKKQYGAATIYYFKKIKNN